MELGQAPPQVSETALKTPRSSLRHFPGEPGTPSLVLRPSRIMPAQIFFRSRQSLFRHGEAQPPLPIQSSTFHPNRTDSTVDTGSSGEDLAAPVGEEHPDTPGGVAYRQETLVQEPPATDQSLSTVARGDGVLENISNGGASTMTTSDEVPLFEDSEISIAENGELGSEAVPDMRRRSLNSAEDLAPGDRVTDSRGDAHSVGVDIYGGENVEAYDGRETLSAGSSGGHPSSAGTRSRTRGMSLGGNVARSGLSRKFVRSLLRHICLRADSRQREDLRLMVETLRVVAGQPGVDMKQELKREAVSLLGPELAREAFEASLNETRNELLRQRTVAAAGSSAAVTGGAQAAVSATATAAAEAANRDLELSTGMMGGGGSAGNDSGSQGAVTSGATRSSSASRAGISTRLFALQGRRSTHPHPRKRKSLGPGNAVDSDPEDVGAPGVGTPLFFVMPEEEVEQRLKAIHKGPQHEDFHLCCICMDRTRDATLIHGKTAHQACCYSCASELFEQGSPCPWCRQPISCVVRNYL